MLLDTDLLIDVAFDRHPHSGTPDSRSFRPSPRSGPPAMALAISGREAQFSSFPLTMCGQRADH